MTPEEDDTATVPPLGDGLAAAGSQLPPPDADPAVTLPEDVDQAVAYAYPALNVVEFHVDTAPGELDEVSPLDLSAERRDALLRLLYTQVKALREELLHGTRSELGTARNVRLVDYHVQRLVDDLAAVGAGESDASVADLVGQLTDLVTLRSSLQAAQEESVETVDKFHVDSLLTQEDGVLEDLLERQAPHELFVDDVRTLLEEQLASERATHADEEQYRALVDLRDRGGWRLAEATALAAADVPFLVEEVVDSARVMGVDVDAFETVPLSDLEDTLARRLDVAIEVAEAATADVPADAPTETLVERIREAVDAETGRDGAEQRPAELALPLLDLPADGAGDAFQGASEPDADALAETETATGYFLAGAFRTVGDFGAAVFLTPGGEWQWVVNPWAGNLRVDTEVGEDVRTYERFWAHDYLCHSVARQIAAAGGRPDRIDCPLCARSAGGHCGIGSCGFASLRADLRRALSEDG